MSHAQFDKHIWWRPTKFWFGGCVDTTLLTELGNISEISTPGLNLVGNIYFSELWASKQAHQVPPPLAHMPEITDYLSKYLGSFNIKYIIYRDI
jgi:hypothetical protein